MPTLKARPLVFPVSQRDQQAIAHGSNSKLKQAWEELQALLRDGERVRADWKKQQFGNARAMLIENEEALRIMIEGMVIYGAYDVTFWAEPTTAKRPSFTPAKDLF